MRKGVRLCGDAIINRHDQLNRNGIRTIACAGSIISRTGVQGARVFFNTRIGVSVIAISFIRLFLFFLSGSTIRVTAPTISRITGENCDFALLSLISSRRYTRNEVITYSRDGQFSRKIRLLVTHEARLSSRSCEKDPDPVVTSQFLQAYTSTGLGR